MTVFARDVGYHVSTQTITEQTNKEAPGFQVPSRD